MQATGAIGKFSRRSAGIAAVFSFLIVGLGHWYLGAWRRALAWELGLFAAAFLGVILDIPDSLFGSLGLVCAAANAADAWRVGLKGGADRSWDWYAIPFALGAVILGLSVLFALFYVSCATGQGCL